MGEEGRSWGEVGMFSPMAGSRSAASVSFLGLFHSLGMEVFLKGMLELKGRTHQRKLCRR